MNLVTIYDYPSTRVNEQKLLLLWLDHVNEYAKNFVVHIIHGESGIPDEVLRKIDSSKNISVKIIKGNKCPIKYDVPRIDNNFHVNFNAYNVLTYGKQLGEPIIYLDLDAILVSDLKEWWDIVNEKKFMGTMHYPIGENLNGGIYSISDWNYIDFDKLIKKYFDNHAQYKKIRDRSKELDSYGKRIRNYTLHDSVFTEDGILKSGDQSLFINYYINSKGTPYYQKLDVGWNYFANYCDYEIENGLIKVKRIQNRMGYNINKVKVLHFYATAKKKLYEKYF